MGHGIQSWGERVVRMMGDEAGERDAVITWGSEDLRRSALGAIGSLWQVFGRQATMSTLIKNALDANWRVIWHGAGRVGAQQGRRKKMSLEEIGTSHTLATCPERMQRKQRDMDH